MFARLRARWRAARGRTAFERQMADEMRFHLESRTADLIAQGVPPHDARRRARLAFGNPAAWAEHCRDARGLRLLEELRQDVRFAWRGIVRRRLTAAIAVLTLRFGIGISSGVFTMLSGAALRSDGSCSRPTASAPNASSCSPTTSGNGGSTPTPPSSAGRWTSPACR
jgi:hypothetical protein